MLTAPSVGMVFIRAVPTMHGAIAHHGVQQTLLPVLADKVHVACAKGLCRQAKEGERRIRKYQVVVSDFSSVGLTSE